MSAIYRGGKSGVVALRLYLGLIWKSSAPPFDTNAPAWAWATLLDLDEPSTLGRRRIASAIKKLESFDLIDVTSHPGRPPEIVLLREDGSGRKYTTPSDDYRIAEQTNNPAGKTDNRYLKIPTALWTSGHIQSMTGPGLILLLILLAERGHKQAVWFGGDQFDLRYTISHKTRTDGTTELQKRDLLTVTRARVRAKGKGGSIFSPPKLRNMYRLINEAGTPTVATPPVKPAKKTKKALKKAKPKPTVSSP